MRWPSPSSRAASAAAGSYLGLISAAATLRHLDQITAHAIASGRLAGDLPTATKLLHRLAELGASAPLLLRLADSVPRPDLFLLNVLLRSLPPSSALPLLASLPRRHPHLRPDSFTYAFASSATAALPTPDLGRVLHARAVVDGFAADPFVGSALAGLYLSFSQTSSAEKVFDGVTNPDTVLWNTLVSGLVQNGSYLRSIKVFGQMVNSGAGLDNTTLAVVLPAAAELQDLNLGALLHGLGMKLGMASHSYTVTGLISVYSKCGETFCAKCLFEETDKPDLITRNAMISGFSLNGDVSSSIGLFKELLASGEKANSSTMVGLIPVFSPFGHECLVRSIHGFATKAGLDLNSSLSTALITVYGRLNDIESARGVFNAMPEKSMASWNAMISGYAQSGFTEMAITLFREMQALNVRPNPVTVTSILSACAQLGALSLGKWVHRIIADEEVEPNVYVSTALIDMYAKCGSIEEARRVFDDMVEKNVVSWNAMILGYGLHGQGREALKLFDEMLDARVAPTGVTFLSVLYACSHGGLVEEGRRAFRSMVSDHGVKPGVEHYACMVDLFGRAGQLNEASEFIKTVPESAGAGVWSALLGACMKHKDTSLARLASEKLFELDPENTGYYVLLSNIYSANQNYQAAAAVRKQAKSRRLVKTPGCTLLEIGDKVHLFMAGDRSHPQSAAIYSMLEKLAGKMAEAGYHAETSVSLYDVEEEEKEHMMKVHSEKLAIVFGLISTEPNCVIRIIKNLRVCLDCHNWTKFVAKVSQRLIVVRDATRFHHFRDGVCSCGDYW